MKAKINFLVCLLILSFSSFAQDSIKTINGNTYGKYGDNWYTLNERGKADLIDLKHLVVRLTSRGSMQNFDPKQIGLEYFNITRDNFVENFYELEIPRELDPFDFAELLESTLEFETIIFNVYVKLNSDSDDPIFPNQWNLGRIDITNAWEIIKGNNELTIAVIDVGADYNHEDLIDNKWGTTGGYDFISNDNDPYPIDGARHGTAVAGILAASSNNELGVAGVAGGWSSQNGVKLMHLRAGFRDITGIEFMSLAAVAQAVAWASVNGARVINMSFGGKAGFAPLTSAINNAYNDYGVIFVASSGNYFNPGPEDNWILFPANCITCQGLISVGATIENDYRKELNDGTNEPWWGSCYGGDGRKLDLMSPGIHIPTTDITGTGGYVPDDYYLNFNGTSAVAPLVSGLVGLMLSVNSSLNYNDIYDIITNTADKVSGMGGQNYHNEYGYGRIDAYAALKYTLENYGGTLTQNLTIPVGETWNFAPGVTVTLENGASIIVNGTLNLNGTSSDGITFDFITKQSGNGIKVNSGATANIFYSDILNAVYGIYFNSATGTVDHCTITNCFYGVYVTSATPTIQYCSINDNFYGLRIFNSYSQSWTARNIANNYIAGNTAYGVYLYNSSPTPTYNTVISNNIGSSFWFSSNPILNHNNFYSNSNHGVACYGNASPSAYYNSSYSFGGYNNVISNGNRGVVVTSTSHPNFGNPGLSTGGYNSIYDNTGYEIDNSAPYFFACNNWWNNPSGPQPGDINGTVRTLPWLEQDPNSSQNSSESPLVSAAYSDVPDELQEAEYEMTINNYLQATYLLRNYLIKHTDDNSFGNMAAVLFLKNLDFYLDQKGIAKEVESLLENKLSRNGQFEMLLGLSSVLSKDGNYNAALDYLEKLEDLIPTIEENNKILFQKAFINLFGMQDFDNVLFYLNEILERNEPNSLDYQLAMEEINSLSSSSDLMPKSNNKETSTNLPKTFNLLDNYPNPFNPTTTIEYSIPEASFVELKIYDILGGEVASLVKENKSSGKHSVKFNASNLPSGIYFYRIVSGNFTATKKLLLLK